MFIAAHRSMWVEKTIRSEPERAMDASITLWARLAEILFPLIGMRNFECLFARSLRVTQTRFDWIARSRETRQVCSAKGDLNLCLAGDGIEGRMLASVSMLNFFLDTLVGLLGEGLTEHVLDLAWAEKQRATSQNFRSFFDGSRLDNANYTGAGVREPLINSLMIGSGLRQDLRQ